MNLVHKWCLLSALLLFSSITLSSPSINLSSSDWTKPQNLNGDWAFKWGEFTPPSTPLVSENIIKVPSFWTTYQNQNGTPYPAKGFGTYQTLVILDQDAPDTLRFKTARIKLAYTLYINGDKVAQMGQPGIDLESSEPKYLPNSFIYTRKKNENNLLITVHISNFRYKRGGIDGPILLGADSILNRKHEANVYIVGITVGFLILMSIYQLTHWARRRREYANGFLGIACLIMAVRVLSSGEKYLSNILPFLSSLDILYLEIVTIFLGLPIVHLYIHNLFPKESNKYICYIAFAHQIIFTGLTTLTSSNALGVILNFFYPYMVLFTIHIFYVGITALYRKREGGLTFSIGLFSMVCAVINDALFEIGVLSTGLYTQYGLMLFALAQAVIMSNRFAKAITGLEQLSEKLEYQVDERTKSAVEARDEALHTADQYKKLSQRVVNILEDERSYLASELHDNVNAQLITTKLFVGEIIRDSKNNKTILEMAVEANKNLSNTYNASKNLIESLGKGHLKKLGLKGAIEESLTSYQKLGYQVHRNIDNTDNINVETAIILYRVLQECLTNISKHTKAKFIKVTLKLTAQYELTVTDDGCGFDQSTTPKGFGIKSMENRAKNVGGSFSVYSSIGHGTTVSISIPHSY